MLASSTLSINESVQLLRQANGIVFVTGTYWDSWGSPLQKFLEDLTPWECSDVWLGKPAAVVVSMQEVGGKAVLSRLQGVLSSLGCIIPPCSGMVYSHVGQCALEAGALNPIRTLQLKPHI